MKHLRANLHFIFLATLAFMLVGCKKGEENSFPSQAPLQVSSQMVVDYTSSQINLKIFGQSLIEGSHPLNLLKFFSDSGCKNLVGQGLIIDFDDTGISLSLPAGPSNIYVSTNTTNECWFHGRYVPSIQPQPPTVSTVSPSSPSRVSFQPALIGNAFPNAATVELFSDSGCTNAVGSGLVSTFKTSGVQVTLPQNATTQIYGRVRDPLNQVSACNLVTSYQHSNIGANAPVFASVSPISPSNQSTTPIVKGTVDSAVDTVYLYKDSACALQIGQSVGSDFASIGAQVIVNANASTAIYAKAIDTNGDPSSCVFLTNFVNDSVAPAAPGFTSATPASPTRLSSTPRIRGTAPSDAVNISLFRNALCTQQIGSGGRIEFTGAGILASVPQNNTTSIYGYTTDAAGNHSACTYFSDFKHNIIPPDPPVFGSTDPISPTNQSITPLILGIPSVTTTSLNFYNDENCANHIGGGSPVIFESTGLVISATENATTTVYVTATDQEGNISACTFLANYAHSNLPAPNPTFVSSFPVSPTRTSNAPYVVGSGPNTLSLIRLYTDSNCSVVKGSGTRIQFSTSGIQVTVPTNATTDIYAKATDVYGNDSSCQVLTTFVHNTIPPLAPTFTSTTPLSPNNQSASPLVKGSAYADPASQLPPSSVVFYDGPSCISQLSSGSPSLFSSTGIVVFVPENAQTSIYAKSFDAAQNSSACTYMTDYVHDTLRPGKPIFVSTNPTSPSFSPTTMIKGVFGPSFDFLSVASVEFYSDSLCQSVLASNGPSAFTGAGMPVTVPTNSTTTIYAASFNVVGNKSDCQALLNFRHYDLPPANFVASQDLDGSVVMSWLPDVVSSPSPTYTIKRATNPNGPYTIMASNVAGTTYRDILVQDQSTYYYRVMASNPKGSSQDSSMVAVTINAPPSTPVTLVTATAAYEQVTLSWAGFPSNMSYRILRSTQPGGPYTELPVTVTSTSYVDMTVTNGLVYYYVVRGTNPAGDSIQSSEVSVQPLDVPLGPINLELAPLLAMPECGGNRGVYFRWTAPSYYNSFSLRRFGGTIANTGATAAWDCNPDNAQNNGLNLYQVSPVWGSIQGGSSPTAFFQWASDPSLLVLPGDGHIRLNWSTSFPADRVNLYKSSSSAGPFTLIGSGLTSGTYLDLAVTNGSAYYYYIQQYAGGVLAGWPSPVIGGMPNANSSVPTSLVLNLDIYGKPELNWIPPTMYNRFKIYRAAAVGGPYAFLGFSNTNQFVDNVPSPGANYYYVVAIWGDAESTPTNTVFFREGIPVGLTATGTASSIQLSWTAVAAATDYQILKSTSPLGPFSLLTTVAGTSYTDTAVVATDGYYYRVLARFADGSSSQPSSIASGKTTGNFTPTGLTAIDYSSGSVTLQWVKPAGVTQMRIKRATLPFGPFTTVTTTTADNYFLGTGLTAGATYYFQVAGLNSGIEYPSATIQVQLFSAPTVPSGSIGSGFVLLNWSPTQGAVTYSLERSLDKTNFSAIATGMTALSYQDNAVTNGTRYYYRLNAHFPGGLTRTSPISLPFIPGLSVAAPSAVSVTTNSSGTDIGLTWVPVAGAQNYNIYLSTSLGGPYGLPVATGSSFQNVFVSSLVPGTTYYFKVSSLVGAVESALSPAVAATVNTMSVAPSAIAVSASTIDVSWSAISGASTYDLLRSTDGRNYWLIATGLGSPNYSDTGVSASLVYNYKYRPVGVAGESMPESAPSQGVNTSISPLVPSALQAIASSNSLVSLQWVGVPNTSTYEVYRSTVSGSGYVSIASVLAGTDSFDDNTVVPGTTYYYVVRSKSASGVESANSNEAGINLTPPLANLVLTNLAGAVKADWSAVAGASGYSIYRSEVSGGPYGLIGTTAGLTYNDSNIINENTYYYVVAANFADGSHSPRSNEQTITRGGAANLVVPIELIDRGLASVSSGQLTFERSQTPLDTNDYNGTSVQYFFEVTASNQDLQGRSIELVDASSSVVASIVVPSGVNSATRLRSSSFSPTAGSDIYRLRLEATTNDDELKVYSARLLVKQVGASKTRLYFPLFTSVLPPTSSDIGGYAFNSSSQTYQTQTESTPYVRYASRLSRIVDYNAWEVEAVYSTSGSARGELRLNNMGTSQPVATTTSEFTSTTVALGRMQLDEGVDQFGSANEGQAYELQVRCSLNCTGGNSVKIYRAGLSVRLQNLAKAEVAYRLAQASASFISPATIDSYRVLFNVTDFSNPQIDYQVVGENTNAVGSTQVLLSEAPTQDFGSIGLSPVPGSTLNFTGLGKQIQRTSTVVAPQSGYRLVTELNPSSTAFGLNSTMLLIFVAP